MKKKNTYTSILWIVIYTVLILTPLIVWLMGPKFSNEFRPQWVDVSVGLGFVGLSIMTLQFVNSGRLKFLNKPFGTDLVYHFHRQIGIASFLMVFAHPILLFIIDQRYLRLLNLLTAPWRARAAVTSVVLLIFLVLTAEYREKFKLSYKMWKFWHGIMATLMIALALVHIFLVGNYVDLPWKKALWIGYSALLVGMLLYTRVIYPIWLINRSYRIKATRMERGDVYTLTVAPDGHKGFTFSPGQFAWLTAWNTPFSDTEHPFSIASSAERKGEFEFSIKNLGPFTKRVQTLKAGDKLYVDGPYGAFNLDRYPEAEQLVFIPGGIGVTPIMSMLRTMADRGDKRPVMLFYCNQEWDSVTFREEVETLESKLNMTTIYTIERPPEGWKGEGGFLNREILRKYIPEDWLGDNSDVFLCGPAPMMNAVERELLAIGYPHSRIHSERYSFA